MSDSNTDPIQRWLRQAESDIAADAPLPAFDRLLASAPSAAAIGARLSGGGCGLAQVAAHWGRTDHLRRLLAAGCPAQLEDNDGDTALIEAAVQGHVDVVATLLAEAPGVQADLPNRAGCTALHAACERKRLSVVRLLLERGGARPDLLDAAGNSAMHALAARLLLPPATGTPSTLTNGLPAAPLELRYFQPAPLAPDPADIAQLMLEVSQRAGTARSFGPDQENGAGYTPLMKCVATGHWSLLPHLLRCFAPRSGWANSHGVNLAHVFHSHHDDSRATRAASALLSRCLGAVEWRSLCAAVVARGPYAGYACLHFACEYRRLGWLPNRLTLSADRNARGETFADILDRRRALVDLRRCLNGATSAIWRQTLLLLDPALGSPRFSRDFGRAKRILAHLSAASGGEEHDYDRGLCQQPQALFGRHSGGVMSYESGRRFWQTGGRENRQYPLAVILLVAAIGEDSPEAFNSLLELGHLEGDWSLAFSRDLLGYLSSGGGAAFLPAVGNGLLPLRPEHLAGLKWLDPLDLAVTLGRSRVVQEMLLARTFDLIPSCLRVLLLCRRMRRVRHRCVSDMRQSAQSVLVNALNCLHDGATSEKERRLIDAFVHGELEVDGARGPTFSDVAELPVLHATELALRRNSSQAGCHQTVLQLLLKAGCEEALSARCVRMLVKRRWRARADCCTSCCARPGLSPAGRLAVHAASLLVFTCLLTVFLVSGAPPDSPWRQAAAVVLLAFALDHLVLGCLVLRWSRRRWPDLAGVWRGTELLLPAALQLVSLVGHVSLRISGPAEYYLRLMLAGSYLLLSVRWLYHLTVFRRTGPTVSILKTLIVDDLLPFLSIFALVTAAFGVFFHAVLSPGGRQFRVSDGHAVNLSPIDSLVEIYSRPLLLAFGEFQIDSLRPCEKRGVGADNCSDLAGADCLCPHEDGLRLYLALFVHLYLFVNLALLNLLIAKFSLTVNTKVDQAFVIWNKHRMRMLCEYQVLPSLPPPLSALNLLYSRLTACRACCKTSSSSGDDSSGCSPSWSHWTGLEACQPYRRYLWLQACKFRNRRRSFLRKVTFGSDGSVQYSQE